MGDRRRLGKGCGSTNPRASEGKKKYGEEIGPAWNSGETIWKEPLKSANICGSLSAQQFPSMVNNLSSGPLGGWEGRGDVAPGRDDGLAVNGQTRVHGAWRRAGGRLLFRKTKAGRFGIMVGGRIIWTKSLLTLDGLGGKPGVGVQVIEQWCNDKP